MTTNPNMTARRPEEVHHLWVKAHNAGDLDGVIAFYEADGCFVTRTGRVAAGAQAVREVYRAILANKPQMTLEVKRVIPAGGDLALVIVPWTVTASLPDGSPNTWSGVATDVVRRQADGRWLLVVDNPYGTYGIQ